MPLHLKPLVERRQDIRAIAAALLLRQQANEAAFVWPTAKAMEKLMAHRWPGNARELGNVLQRALVLREGERIAADDPHIPPDRKSVGQGKGVSVRVKPGGRR